MKIRCPACNHEYEDDGGDYRIEQNNWTYQVCKPCFVAYLKIRVVKGGQRLRLEDLHLIGKVRKKIKS